MVDLAMHDLASSTVQYGSTQLPRHELSLTGLGAALDRDDSDVADAAKRYGALLRGTIDAALRALPSYVAGSRTALGNKDSPLLVSVEGPPRIHQILWETLDCMPGSGDEGAVLVAHLPEGASVAGMDAAARYGIGPTALRWIGSRPFEKDLPRYLVAGPIASCLLGVEAAKVDALHLEAVRTDACYNEARLLLRERSSRPLVLHLDVHGTSRMRPAKESGFIAEPEFHAAFRDAHGSTISLSEQSVLDDVIASGAHMFVTNACFGAQQRDVNQSSMPARLIASGCHVAVAVREPIDGNGAMLFFTHFYKALSEKRTVGSAFSEARTFLVHHPAGAESGWSHRSARYGLQPVLWVQDLRELFTHFGDPGLYEGLSPARAETDPLDRIPLSLSDYIELARLNDGFARVVEGVEDRVWAGRAAASIGEDADPDPLADLDSADIDDLISQLSELVGGARVANWVAELGPTNERQLTADAVEANTPLAFPRFSSAERLLLVALRFFGQSNPLRELLTRATPGDVRLLDYLASTTDHNVERALLLALAWSESSDVAIEVSPAVAAVLNDFASACKQFAHEKGLSAEYGAFLAQAHIVDWALPLVGIQRQFMEVTVPTPLRLPRPIIDQLPPGSLTILRAGGETALHLSRRNQFALRRRVGPIGVAAANQLWRSFDDLPKRLMEATAAWNDGTKSVCATWLSLAIAYRQIGLVHPFALQTALAVLGLVDRGAVLLILDALIKGMPGWEPISEPSVIEVYESRRAAWSDLHHHSDDTEVLEAVSDTTEYALALLHAGRFSEMLDVTSRIVARISDADGMLPGIGSDPSNLDVIEVRSTHAYALVSNGRVDEAIAFAVPIAKDMRRLALYQQCEFLHLLGDLMESAGKPAAAIAYMLQERSRRPPALHRRLHNRDHLLALLLSDGADHEFEAVIAREGLQFALAARSRPHIDRFSAALALLAPTISDRGRADAAAILAVDIDDPSPIVHVARIILSHSLDRQLDKDAIATMRNYIATGEQIVSLVCYYLAQDSSLGADDRVDILTLGADKDDTYGRVCLLDLVEALLVAKEWGRLAEPAARLIKASPKSGLALVALGIVQLEGGDRPSAVETIARGLCYDTLLELFRSHSGISELVRANEALFVEAGNRSLELLVQLSDQLEAGTPMGQTILPGLDLSDVFDRVYDINRHVDDVDLRVVETLIQMSERAWDRADYRSAINARSRACQLLEKTGDRAKLATELGWLATLVKQSGSIEDAMSLYQRAIAVADGVLFGAQLSSLIGRYANLLHQNGDFEAAARAQWRAVVVAARTHSPAEYLHFPPPIEVLAARLDFRQLTDLDLERWPLLLINFANCLKDAGYPGMAKEVLKACYAASAAARNSVSPHAGHNSREVGRLYPRVHGSLRAMGQDLADVPEIVHE